MRYLTILDVANNAPLHKRASELANDFKGRPKSFPDVLIVRETEDGFQVIKVEDATYNGLQVEVLLERIDEHRRALEPGD